jgi:hypothetical protein
MNVLEHYILEVHNVEPYTAEWTSEFPDRDFISVDCTDDCYGHIKRAKHVWDKKEWAKIQEQGYYMG